LLKDMIHRTKQIADSQCIKILWALMLHFSWVCPSLIAYPWDFEIEFSKEITGSVLCTFSSVKRYFIVLCLYEQDLFLGNNLLNKFMHTFLAHELSAVFL